MGTSGVDAPGSVLTEESVMVNVATPYLHVSFALTGTNLRVCWPETTLGLIPRGMNRLEVPLTDLTSIRFAHRVIPARLAVVIALISLVAGIDLPDAATAVIVVLAVWLLLVSIVGVVEVIQHGGRSIIPVCLLQKKTVTDFIALVPPDRTSNELDTS